MKRVATYTGLGILLGMLGLCCADDEKEEAGKDPEVQTTGEKSAPEKKAKKEVSPVAKALAKMHCFNGKPMKDAKCYVYLQSASWCGPCREEMPKIAEEYKEMKKAGVEIVLISHDQTEKGAKAYLKEFKAKFPGFMPERLEKNKLPGFVAADSIPHATFVDATGKVLKDGHGSITLSWKEIVPSDTSDEEQTKEE